MPPSSQSSDPELDALVRRVDEDRWLASRFAPAPVRRKLIALYAVNYELGRISDVAHEPGIGVLRLTWWRDALASLAHDAHTPAHPALSGLQRAGVTAEDAALLAEMVEARGHDVDDAPFADAATLEAYVDATAGALMWLASKACAQDHVGEAETLIREAGRAWGYAGMARSRRKGIASVDLSAHAHAAYMRARALAPTASPAMFPAFGYVALTPRYLRALQVRRKPPSLFGRQLKLVFASASGGI